MRNVTGATSEEQRLIKAVQSAVGAVPDGSIGTQTMSDIACRLGADCFPLNLTIYGKPCIIARDALPAAVNAPLSAYGNAISGSFSYQQKPCSILVSGGKVVCGCACHAHLGKPETVLYRLADGTFGAMRCLYASELPDGVAWAVGGVGLIDYDPAKEGFAGAYADVLRKTAHTWLGVKNGCVYLGYVASMTGAQVRYHVHKMGMEHAILLDGGHVAAINGKDDRKNTGQRQYYIVQGVN